MRWREIEDAADFWIRRLGRPPAIAVYFVYLAVLLTLLVQPIIPYPFLFLFFGAIIASAWQGGVVSGLIAVALSAVAARIFIPPFYSFDVSREGQAYFISFVCCSLAVSWVSSMKRRSDQTMKRAHDDLEERVRERTIELERSHAETLAGERRLRRLTEAIPQQLWSAAPDGRLLYCNQHLADSVGAPSKRLVDEGLEAMIAPEDREDFARQWRESLASGRPLEGEWRVRAADGGWRWRLLRVLPQRDPEGAIERWHGVHIDIDDRRRAEHELAMAQGELANRARMANMSELAASIAHEVNQPLTAASTQATACVSWLESEPANVERALASARRVAAESRRAGDVVKRIRAIFDRRAPQAERAQVNAAIADLPRLLRDETAASQTPIHMRLAEELPPAAIDEVSLQQLLLNLVRNALDAMRETPVGERELSIVSEATREGVRVTVSDRGPGVPPEVAPRMFEAFFTTKSEGLGMGLSICRSIVEAHDGSLWAEPREGGGSSFRFIIPASR